MPPRKLKPVFDALEAYDNWLLHGPYTWRNLASALDDLVAVNHVFDASKEISNVLHHFSIRELNRCLPAIRTEPYVKFVPETLVPDFVKFDDDQQRVLLAHLSLFDLMSLLTIRILPLSNTDKNFIKLGVISKHQAVTALSPSNVDHEPTHRLIDELDPVRANFTESVREFIVDGPYTALNLARLSELATRCTHPSSMLPAVEDCLHRFPPAELSAALLVLDLKTFPEAPYAKFNLMSVEQLKAYASTVDPVLVQELLSILMVDKNQKLTSRLLVEAILEADAFLFAQTLAD